MDLSERHSQLLLTCTPQPFWLQCINKVYTCKWQENLLSRFSLAKNVVFSLSRPRWRRSSDSPKVWRKGLLDQRLVGCCIKNGNFLRYHWLVFMYPWCWSLYHYCCISILKVIDWLSRICVIQHVIQGTRTTRTIIVNKKSTWNLTNIKQ